ncbi:hypothetical protein D3C72_1810520 [compost metagenome]
MDQHDVEMLDRLAQCQCPGQQGFAQHDDVEQPVALHDVMAMPGRRGGQRFGDGGHGDLQHDPDRPKAIGAGARQRLNQHEGQPVDLDHGDADRVGDGRLAVGRVGAAGAKPEHHHGDAHHHIADDHRGEIGRGGKEAREPGGHDQRSRHDDHR